MSRLREAFEASSEGFSPDRVVADPELNASFLEACRRLGISGSPATLNRSLLNLRKQGGLRGIRSHRTSFPKEDEYRFAAEIAVRILERRDGVSLDDVISDPELAAEFDRVAAQIAPGFTAVEYRWAALNLRKARRLKPELLGRVIRAERVQVVPVAGMDVSTLPLGQGLYALCSAQATLYVGEAENLQNRLRKHLDHSDNKELARRLWEVGSSDLHVELHVLPQGTDTRTRKAMELELIRSRKPLFNVKR